MTDESPLSHKDVERLKQRRWINPYIHRLDDHSDMILYNSNEAPIQQTIDRVQHTASQGTQCYIELGSGSGSHLLDRAEADPKNIYFGMELRFKRVVRTAEKAKERGISNIFLLRTDAKNLSSFFSPQSISGFYMNFPDPWDKLRWRKNRMMGEVFLGSAAALLLPQGFIAYKTDHQGSFEHAEQVIEGDKRFRILEKTSDLYQSEYLSCNVQTEFEQLFCSKKLPIYYIKTLRI